MSRCECGFGGDGWCEDCLYLREQDISDDNRALGRTEGKAEERKRIAAWLRSDWLADLKPIALAEAIERCDHWASED